MTAIELIGLNKTYRGDNFALNNVTLKVPKCSIFGLIGPNGAGKTSIINILSGVVKKTSGTIRIFGQEINHSDYKYKRRIGFILEEPHYLEKLTIDEYLKFSAALYGMDSSDVEKRVSELIKFFDLDDKKKSRIETYSKGMKKKVSLASAIIHNPELLILDEPLEGIDPLSVKKVKEALLLMVSSGVTILLSSHDLNTIENLCDEVAIIHNGKLVFQSKTECIRRKIKDELNSVTYQSLEEIFIDVVSDEENKPSSKLSWL